MEAQASGVVGTRRVGAGVGEVVAKASFRWYLGGMAVFSLAQTMNRFMLPWLAYEASHSSTVLGLVGLALAAPTLILSPIGGVWADRTQRLTLIRRTQGVWVVLFLVFAVVFAAGKGSLLLIVVVAIASGALIAFDQPARQALIPALVPTSGLSSAYGLLAASWNLSGLIGPSLAAALLAVALPLGLGAAPLLVVTAIGSVVMVLMTMRIRESIQGTARSKDTWWQELATGLRFIADTPAAGGLVLLAFGTSLFGFSAVFLMPAFAAEVFDANVGQLGVIVSAWGAGALVGITAIILGTWDRHRRIVLFTPGALGLTLLIFSASRTFEISVVLMAVAGALAFTYLTVAQTILQLLVPDALAGRVMGIYVLNYAISPLGATMLGILGGAVGAASAIGVGALVLCGLSLVVIRRTGRLRDNQ